MRRAFFRIILGAALCAAATPATNAGNLVWEKTVREVSVGPEAQDVTAEFGFKNTGKKPVTISSVDVACDCTTTSLAQTRYAPGECGVLKVSFEIGDNQGRVEQSVVVTTDEPGSAPTWLLLRMNLPEYLHVAPRSVRWTVGAKPMDQIITCTAAPDREITIEAVTSPDPNFRTELEVVERCRIYRLHVTPRSTAPHAAVTLQLHAKVGELGARVFHAYAYITDAARASKAPRRDSSLTSAQPPQTSADISTPPQTRAATAR
jgi:hypothetical protein